MSAKEKDAFYRAALAIGKVVSAHPKLLPEDIDEHDNTAEQTTADNPRPMRTTEGGNGGATSGRSNYPGS